MCTGVALQGLGVGLLVTSALLLVSPVLWVMRGVTKSMYQANFTTLKGIPEPPCPNPWLLKYVLGHGNFGIVAIARRLLMSDTLQTILKYRRSHGGIFVLRSVLGRPVILVMDMSALRRVLLGAPYRYGKLDTAVRLLAPIIGFNGLVTVEGDTHKRLRRKLSPALHHTAVLEYSAVFLDEAKLLRQRISSGLKEHPSAPVKMNTHTGAATCATIVRAFFPEAVLSQARLERIKQLYQTVLGEISLVFRDFILQSVFFFVPSRWITRCRQEKREIRQKAGSMLKEAKVLVDARREKTSVQAPDKVVKGMPESALYDEAPTEKPESSMVETFLSSAGMPLSRQEQVDNLLTFLLAGQSTTAFTLSYCLYRMGRHPQWQARVYEEVSFNAVWRDASVPAKERVDAAAALPLVGRVLKETLRMHPPVLNTSRLVLEDDVLCGHKIPAGAALMLPIHAVHFDETHWDSPFEFNPDRFLPEIESKRDRLAWLPFLHGARRCIGQQFGLRELAVFLADLVYHFEFSTDLSAPEPVHFTSGILGFPKVEVFAKIRPSVQT